jgi:hypothetical protein
MKENLTFILIIYQFDLFDVMYYFKLELFYSYLHKNL